MDLTKQQYKNYIQSLKKPNKDTIEKNIKESISETQLLQYFGYNISDDIITYSQLDDYKTIEELLPNNYDYKIILIEESKNNGHWVLLTRYGNVIEYFNSYGAAPSYEIDLLDNQRNIELDQDDKYLNKLLTLGLDKFKIIYNKKRFQKLEDGINTCGRHCILRLLMLLNFKMDLERYIEYMENLKKKFKMDYDQLVSMIII
jgi:hypothetical protein